jgi:hypothetical protein
MNGADALNLSDAQRAVLADLITAEQCHATRWWTHLNELRRRNELPDWAKGRMLAAPRTTTCGARAERR